MEHRNKNRLKVVLAKEENDKQITNKDFGLTLCLCQNE